MPLMCQLLILHSCLHSCCSCAGVDVTCPRITSFAQALCPFCRANVLPPSPRPPSPNPPPPPHPPPPPLPSPPPPPCPANSAMPARCDTWCKEMYAPRHCGRDTCDCDACHFCVLQLASLLPPPLRPSPPPRPSPSPRPSPPPSQCPPPPPPPYPLPLNMWPHALPSNKPNPTPPPPKALPTPHSSTHQPSPLTSPQRSPLAPHRSHTHLTGQLATTTSSGQLTNPTSGLTNPTSGPSAFVAWDAVRQQNLQSGLLIPSTTQLPNQQPHLQQPLQAQETSAAASAAAATVHPSALVFFILTFSALIIALLLCCAAAYFLIRGAANLLAHLISHMMGDGRYGGRLNPSALLAPRSSRHLPGGGSGGRYESRYESVLPTIHESFR